ncbi:MAG: twin-arginine translocation signal domain-containing protein [Dechloromonas sp.]|nr:twin-arginine translocation signal domain-containing protein [Dechloromonas sp.]
MCGTSRRDFLGRLTVGGLTLTPLALTLSACGKSEWPEGMAEIKWDRETCPRCSMVISDRRFAAQLRGGPKDMVVKFDDIGCFTFWISDNRKAHPWLDDPATCMWVADVTSKGKEVIWLDPRKAQYITRTSPMGYNFGAVADPQTGSLDFAGMRQHVLAKGK